MGFENLGRVWTPETLRVYLQTRERPQWIGAVVLHHTAYPNLATRPRGFTIQHILNIADYYRRPPDQGGRGWSSGPHLFVDDEQVFGMCDFASRGVHALSFNHDSLGIEVLGNYDEEDQRSGRGLRCWQIAASVSRELLAWLRLPVSRETLRFHRDDPRTAKTCPGARVDRAWVTDLVAGHEELPQGHPRKPDLAFAWNVWAFTNGGWCVPLYDFLRESDVPGATITAKLSIRAGEVYYGETYLPGAYYLPAGSPQQPNNCTWAPASELLALL